MAASPVRADERTAPAEAWEAGEQRARRAASRLRMRRLAYLVAGWVAALAVWELASTYLLAANVLPGPAAVAVAMWEIVRSGSFIDDFVSSVSKTFIGFGVATAIGAPAGYLMGRYRYWRAFFHDTVTVGGTIPALAYAPMTLVIFGLSKQGPILAVALVSFPYIAFNVAEGIRGADKNLVSMSRAFRRSPGQIRRHVFMPTIVPFVFVAVRISFAVAWKVEALTEVFGGTMGIGFQIRTQYQLYSIVGVLSWMFLFIAFMLIIERVVLTRIERWLLRWRPKERVAL